MGEVTGDSIKGFALEVGVMSRNLISAGLLFPFVGTSISITLLASLSGAFGPGATHLCRLAQLKRSSLQFGCLCCCVIVLITLHK